MQDSHEKPVEVDFRRRDTEGGWQGTLDRFGLAAAPTWFDWLEWVLVLRCNTRVCHRAIKRMPQTMEAKARLRTPRTTGFTQHAALDTSPLHDAF
jgi:hypothetical protein